ncbi:MAG: type IV pilus assembly protein PilM [Candidatus Eisenbacteria bacterium]
MPLISKKQKSTIGLDVGSYAIKVVEMKQTAAGSEITKVGVKKLLPGAIVDGEPMDRDAVVTAIKEVFEEKEITNKEVVSAICGRSVIIKKIKMDEMDDETAREVMTLEAEQYVPFEQEELSVDFEILRRGLAANTMEVLLVAAKKDKVLSHVELLRDADLIPAIIDIDTFAVQNAYELNYEYEQDKVYALIDIGLSATNIGIVRNGIPIFNRDIQFGGETFVEGMQRRLGITSEEARAALEGVPGAKPEGVLKAIETVGEDLSIAVERSFSYLRSSGEAEAVDKIFLSGGGARIAGLRSFLGEKLSVEVDLANPLRNVECQEEILEADPIAIGPSLMVAIGLATRQGS